MNLNQIHFCILPFFFGTEFYCNWISVRVKYLWTYADQSEIRYITFSADVQYKISSTSVE